MTTDKERLKDLLTSFGVGFEEEGQNIVCREGCARIDGYAQFMTVFEFDAAGEFIQMGAWE